jgi:predicted GNAT superfamily acetyltransferase
MRSNPESITIRDIDTIAEMRQIEVLQKEIWGGEDLEVFPALALRPLKELGGVLIGAFKNHELVGFVFGFPGIIEGEMVIHSDMLGVRPEFRSLSLGFLLKLAQRNKALQSGINKITWTFDPLQSRNAHLNFGKLGVTSDRYEIDFYGVTTSFLHQGSTDRLWVTWDLKSERVQQRIETPVRSELKHSAPFLVHTDEAFNPVSLAPNYDEPELLIEIPRERDDSSSAAWREATRTAFIEAFKHGYRADEFFLTERGTLMVGCYLLRQRL